MSSAINTQNSHSLLNPQNPLEYHSKGNVQEQRALENLANWEFNPTDFVLDIGCGPGTITANVSKHVPYGSAIGLDLNPKMCNRANEVYSHSNLSFIVGDAHYLPFNEQFDKIICFAVLSWIPLEFHQQIFDEIARVLKIGGKALLRMTSEGARPLNIAVQEVIKRPKWSPLFSNFASPAAYQNENRLREISKQAGLTVVRIEDATKNAKFDSKEKFIDWLLTWEPHRLAVDELQRKEFMTEVVEEYCQQLHFDNTISITLPGILIEVEKKSTFSQFSTQQIIRA